MTLVIAAHGPAKVERAMARAPPAAPVGLGSPQHAPSLSQHGAVGNPPSSFPHPDDGAPDALTSLPLVLPARLSQTFDSGPFLGAAKDQGPTGNGNDTRNQTNKGRGGTFLGALSLPHPNRFVAQRLTPAPLAQDRPGKRLVYLARE